MHATSLLLAVTGLLMPALFALGGSESFLHREVVAGTVAAVLIALYVGRAGVHADHPRAPVPHPRRGRGSRPGPARGDRHAPARDRARRPGVGFLVGSLEPALEDPGVCRSCSSGLIVIPIIGNAAEHSSAVMFALRNKVDVTLEIAIGSCTQIALFVAPALVFISLLDRAPDGLRVQHLRGGRGGLSTLLVAFISLDGRSNWLEGASADGRLRDHGHLVLLRGAPVRGRAIVIGLFAILGAGS